MFREFVAAKREREDAQDRDTTMAWVIAALGRQKKLPALKTLLTKREAKQNAKQMRTTLQLISEAYRLPLRKKKKR